MEQTAAQKARRLKEKLDFPPSYLKMAYQASMPPQSATLGTKVSVHESLETLAIFKSQHIIQPKNKQPQKKNTKIYCFVKGWEIIQIKFRSKSNAPKSHVRKAQWVQMQKQKSQNKSQDLAPESTSLGPWVAYVKHQSSCQRPLNKVNQGKQDQIAQERKDFFYCCREIGANRVT